MLSHIANLSSPVTPTYVDDVFTSYTYKTQSTNYTSKSLPISLNLVTAADTDPDWTYVKRLLPLLASDSYDAVDGTFLGGNLNGGAGYVGPFGATGIVSYATGDADYRTNINPPTGYNYGAPFCIEAWVKCTSTGPDDEGMVWLHSDGVPTNDWMQIYASSYGGVTPSVYVWWRRGGVNLVNTSALMTIGVWNFVSISYDSTNLYIHVNGTLKSTTAVSPATQTMGTTALGCWTIAGLGNPFAGMCQYRMTFGTSRASTRNIVPTRPFPVCGDAVSATGYLLWFKRRDAIGSHQVLDHARQVWMSTDTTTAPGNSSGISIKSTGITLQSHGSIGSGTVSASEVLWAFKAIPKFLDIVTYTGTGTNRTIAHALGLTPGMIIIKRTDTSGAWQVYHSDLTNSAYGIQLNSTSAQSIDTTLWNSTAPTASVFSLGTNTSINASGGTYVAYLFAHDTSSDSIIKCGSFTSDASGNGTINTGWEPQFILYKSRSTTNIMGWCLYDISRDFTVGKSSRLQAESTASELVSVNGISLVSNGASLINLDGNAVHIYLAIRRPNKPPTLGTQVYNMIARTGNGTTVDVTGVGFPLDMIITKERTSANHPCLFDRLRGPLIGFTTSLTSMDSATFTGRDITAFLQDGVSLGQNHWYGINGAGVTIIHNFFKRAPSVFDIVAYTGTATAQTLSHSLTVVPELVIIKRRDDASTNWIVWASALSSTDYLYLNLSNAKSSTGGTAMWNSTTPTITTFTVGTDAGVNSTGIKFMAYLFASKVGISKVGSYTGNGGTQTINCAFTTGARFILIKRTDVAGDWFYWDTARGIVAGNDPYLSINTAAAEITTNDSVDPDTSGFIVNQVAATNINVTSATYIYLAFA